MNVPECRSCCRVISFSMKMPFLQTFCVGIFSHIGSRSNFMADGQAPMGCSTGKRRSYPLHARRAAAARRAGGAHGWPRVFKLARNGDETAVCRRPKAVNACLLRPHPSSYTHGSIHRKQRLHIWPQCRAHSISWHVAIASLTLLEHSGRQRADGDENRRKPWYSKLKLVVVRTKRGPTTTAAQRGTRLQPARFLTLLEARPAGLSSPPARSLQ